MKLKAFHAPFIARKILLNFTKSGIVSFTCGTESVVASAQKLLLAEVEKERLVELKANELMEQNEDKIAQEAADEAALFWLIKRQVAAEFGLLLEFEERFSDFATRLLAELQKEGLLKFNVAQNRVKNIIFSAIDEYVKGFTTAEDAAFDKLKAKGVKIGGEEWSVLFEKYYENELKSRGLI